MIIGNGMLATAFSYYKDNEQVVIFASGVSNSREVRDSEFNREYELLKNIILLNKDKILVYFSTISMYDPNSNNSPYVMHKIRMENYISSSCNKYHIFRISQIIGRANNSTLINFLLDHIANSKNFELWAGMTRNLIALDDVVKIVKHLIDNKIHLNQIVNLANPSNILVLDLVKILETALGKKAIYHLNNTGLPMINIDISLISSYFCDLGISFNDNYYLNAALKLLNQPRKLS